MTGRRLALIVGCGTYKDVRLKKLDGPVADVTELARVLSDPALGNFQVATSFDETNHQVLLAIDDFLAEGQPDDLLFLHFSCHGLKDSDGKLYFAANDTRQDRLLSTALSSHTLNELLAKNRSRRKILFLDCCYGGAFLRGVSHRGNGRVGVLDRFSQGQGLAVITSSDALQYAFERGQSPLDLIKTSVFTRTVVKGIESGAADSNGDGLIGITELFDYVSDEMANIRSDQKPEMNVFRVQGELVLSRSRNTSITVECNFEEARKGFEKAITVGPQTVQVVVPSGATDGQRISMLGVVSGDNATDSSRDLIVTIRIRSSEVAGKVPLGYLILRSAITFIIASLIVIWLWYYTPGANVHNLWIVRSVIPGIIYGFAMVATGFGVKGAIGMITGVSAFMPFFMYALLTPRSKLDAVASAFVCLTGFVVCGGIVWGIKEKFRNFKYVVLFTSVGIISAVLTLFLGMQRADAIGCPVNPDDHNDNTRCSRSVELAFLYKGDDVFFKITWFLPLLVPISIAGLGMTIIQFRKRNT